MKRTSPISYTDRLLFGEMPGSWRQFIAHATRVCQAADAELARLRRAGQVLAKEATDNEADASNDAAVRAEL
jgi:hypothetical protein